MKGQNSSSVILRIRQISNGYSHLFRNGDTMGQAVTADGRTVMSIRASAPLCIDSQKLGGFGGSDPEICTGSRECRKKCGQICHPDPGIICRIMGIVGSSSLEVAA